jgi:cbb3-type cytochrome oxidase maturation protein
MYALFWLLPLTLLLAGGGLVLFLWCVRSGQFPAKSSAVPCLASATPIPPRAKLTRTASVMGPWVSSPPSDRLAARFLLPSVVGARAATSSWSEGTGKPI